METLELSVVGRNLLENHHAEQGGTNVTEVEDSVYGQVTWNF